MKLIHLDFCGTVLQLPIPDSSNPRLDFPTSSTVSIMFNASLVAIAAAFAFINSAATAPITDLLSRGTESSVPRLIQYVQTFHPQDNEDGQLSLLPLIRRKTGITHVILAALHINGPNGDITLNDDNPNSTIYDRTWSEAATLQRNGVKVMVMMGGAAQGSYDGRLCNSDTGEVQDDYYLGLESTLKYHSVDGLDLDIEEALPLACPINLVNRIRADFGDDFIITMAPVASDLTSKGGSAFGRFSYSRLDRSAAGKEINWYNGQYYSGFVQGSLEDSYEGAINNGYTPDRIVMGVLNSENDGSGFVGLGEVKETIANLKSQYSNFGGVDGWEYFDAGSSDGLGNPWQWTRQIGKAVFSSSSLDRRSGHVHSKHSPPLPSGVAALMAEGHGQIDAARAIRLAKGNEEQAREILKQS